MDDLDVCFDIEKSLQYLDGESYASESGRAPIARYIENINYSEIEKVKIVGRGVFGKVYRCKYRGKIYALKTLTNSLMLTSKEKERHIQSLKLEARALSKIRVCDYVVELAGTCLDKNNQICILMEYVHGPNLHQFMENFHHRLPWKKKEALAWEIASGVNFIHDSNILHRDLKSDNILVSLVPLTNIDKIDIDVSELMKSEPNLQYIHAKIADFGICKISTDNYSTNESFRGAGSPPWMAPELCMDETLVPTKYSDVYSLGWILWELAVSDGRRPYEGHTMNQIFQFKLSGYVEPLPNEVPEYYRELVTACTSYTASDRPYASQVVETIRDAQEADGADDDILGYYEPFGKMYGTNNFHPTRLSHLNEKHATFEGNIEIEANGMNLASEASLREFTTPGKKEALLETLAKKCVENDFQARTDMLVLFGIRADSEAILLCGMGDCYSSGSHGFTNFVRAIKCYESSASLNYSPAITKLGLCYRDGIGKQQSIAKAIHCFEMAAELDDPIAQCCLGECYTLGIGVEQDYQIALNFFELSANKGNADSQMQLGKCYYNGLGVKVDPGKAHNYFMLAASQDHPEALYILGVMYAQGISVPPNKIESYNFFLRAAKLDHPEGQNNVGSCYYFGRGVEKDYAKAVEWFFKAAAQNSSSAQNNLGHCYEMGHGVEMNASEAYTWFQKAANNHHPGAQNSLANFYMTGRSVPKSPYLAFEWYLKSAENNHPRGQKNLALCYYEGIGTVKDYKEAYYWYTKAAEQGNLDAMMKLGKLANNGEGVPADPTLAFYWYNRAAEANDPNGQIAVGKCFLRGRGVPKNLDEGFIWISKAASQNHVTAITYLGVCFLNGHGCMKNPAKAYQCFLKASGMGSAQASFHLGDLYRKGVGVPEGSDLSKAIHYYELSGNKRHPMALFYLGVCYHRGLGTSPDLNRAVSYLKESHGLGCKEAEAYLEKIKLHNANGLTKGYKEEPPRNLYLGRPPSPKNIKNGTNKGCTVL